METKAEKTLELEVTNLAAETLRNNQEIGEVSLSVETQGRAVTVRLARRTAKEVTEVDDSIIVPLPAEEHWWKSSLTH